MWAVCSPSQAQILLHFGSAVWTLSRISSLHIYCPQAGEGVLSVPSTPPPEGSLVGMVDHTCQLHLHVQVCSIHIFLLQHHFQLDRAANIIWSNSEFMFMWCMTQLKIKWKVTCIITEAESWKWKLRLEWWMRVTCVRTSCIFNVLSYFMKVIRTSILYHPVFMKWFPLPEWNESWQTDHSAHSA